MKTRLLVAMLASLAAFMAAPAAASALPYHTDPQFVARYSDAGGSCALDFTNPTVHGYAYEFVYWQLVAAIPNGYGGWRYEYAEWRRALTSPAGMIYGVWHLIGWGQNDYLTPAMGYSRIWVTRGERWIGYRLHYSSQPESNRTHTIWLGSIVCP